MKEKQPFYKFKAYLVEQDIKQRNFAKMIGMNESTLSQKINRKGSEFTITEIQQICDVLGISADEFFLIKPFQKREINKLIV